MLKTGAPSAGGAALSSFWRMDLGLRMPGEKGQHLALHAVLLAAAVARRVGRGVRRGGLHVVAPARAGQGRGALALQPLQKGRSAVPYAVPSCSIGDGS